MAIPTADLEIWLEILGISFKNHIQKPFKYYTNKYM
jgi:hypothetical protein